MAAKDLTAIGLEILQTARNELYLNLPYLDVALCSLDFQPGGGVTLSLATDGETLYYDGSFLSERYLRSRTAVDRAYLHVLLHCKMCIRDRDRPGSGFPARCSARRRYSRPGGSTPDPCSCRCC